MLQTLGRRRGLAGGRRRRRSGEAGHRGDRDRRHQSECQSSASQGHPGEGSVLHFRTSSVSKPAKPHAGRACDRTPGRRNAPVPPTRSEPHGDCGQRTTLAPLAPRLARQRPVPTCEDLVLKGVPASLRLARFRGSTGVLPSTASGLSSRAAGGKEAGFADRGWPLRGRGAYRARPARSSQGSTCPQGIRHRLARSARALRARRHEEPSPGAVPTRLTPSDDLVG